MRNKNKKVRLLVFLALIVLLSGCGGSLATKTGTTPISFEKASRPTISGTPGLRLKGSPTVGPTPKATPTATATTPTPVPTAAPSFISGGRFTTLPLGSSLPSDAECAARVRYSSWEPRPQNNAANHTNIYAQGYRLTVSSDLAQYGYQSRVTGNFTGTTDEILQWAACKWGIDEDIVRAQAVQESLWLQSDLGDCNGGNAPGGCQSVGIVQVKGADSPPTFPGTYPYAAQSTAFDVDYAYAIWRSCFEGKETWLGNGYHAGDVWGCVGRWYSGDWYGNSLSYIANVKNFMAAKAWLQSGF